MLGNRGVRAVLGAVVLLVVSGPVAEAQFSVGVPQAPAVQPEFVPGEILVKFRDGVPAEARRVWHAILGGAVIAESPFGRFEQVAVPAGLSEQDAVDLYRQVPDVEYAELNSVCHATGTPNDTYYGFQWHLPQIDMPAAWDDSTGSGVVVAVLDSGVAYENHPVPSWEANTVASGVSSYALAPDLASTTFVPGYDFINNDSHANDNNSHGTHVAGTVAGSTNDNYGVAGVAYNASIMPVKVLDYTGSGSASALANGLYFAADNGADVVNMSLSWAAGYNPGSTVANAIAYAYNAGVTLVAAAGNEGIGTVSYPAAYSQVIAVGATRYDLSRSYYSQYGSGLEIMAPGGDVTIDQNGDGYVDGVLQMTIAGYQNAFNKADPTSFSWSFFQGTSMASPHVAGVVALMIANGITGVETIRDALADTATDLGSPGYDTGYGWGLVNAAAAVNAGGGGPPADTTPPTPDPMGFASAPQSTGTSSISMTATTASDTSGVEYFFEALTAGGHDSGWQDGTTYEDTGLAADTTYSYRVKARDKSANQNETGWSGSASATTDSNGGGGGPVEISFDDFEAGWGHWLDGGSDCRRYTGGTYSHQGAASINIQDNTNSSVMTYASTIDLTGYSTVTVDFWFRMRSMEKNEDFWLQYNDGSGWQTVAAYVRGQGYSNNVFYNETVVLSSSQVPFTANARFRFRCDASGNGDDVYIDEVRITVE